MDIEQIRAPIADDMQAVNALIRRQLHSDVVLINQLASYIIDSGGKRLRPVTVLLAARPAATPATGTSTPPPSSNSSTPLPCCTTMWWTNPACGADGKPPTPSGAIRPACWWAIFCIPVRSR
jgi:hypothetical protein